MAAIGKAMTKPSGKRAKKTSGKALKYATGSEKCCCAGGTSPCHECGICCFAESSTASITWAMGTPYFTSGDGAAGGYSGSKSGFSSPTFSVDATTWPLSPFTSPVVAEIQVSCSTAPEDGVNGPFWTFGAGDPNERVYNEDGSWPEQYLVSGIGWSTDTDHETIIANSGDCCGATEAHAIIEVYHIVAGSGEDDPVGGRAVGYGSVTITISDNPCCSNGSGCVSIAGGCDGQCECAEDLCLVCDGSPASELTVTISGTGTAADGTYSITSVDLDTCNWEVTSGGINVFVGGNGDMQIRADDGVDSLFESTVSACLTPGLEYSNTIGTGTVVFTYEC